MRKISGMRSVNFPEHIPERYEIGTEFRIFQHLFRNGSGKNVCKISRWKPELEWILVETLVVVDESLYTLKLNSGHKLCLISFEKVFFIVPLEVNFFYCFKVWYIYSNDKRAESFNFEGLQEMLQSRVWLKQQFDRNKN